METLSDTLLAKVNKIKEIIKRYSSAVVAFSAGVDSTLLAYLAKETLNGKLLLVTAKSLSFPDKELDEAKKIAAFLQMDHQIIQNNEFDNPEFIKNTKERCYYCKKDLFIKLVNLANINGYDCVMEGSNYDDLNDYRPGRKALEELYIISPLCEAELSKKEIRELSGYYGLPTSLKPSYACLSSRFPYEEQLTAAKIKRVELVENQLKDLGFTQFRVRSHENLARLEFIETEMDKAWSMRKELTAICKKAGFIYFALDLIGYRSGAMNESL